MLRVAKVSAGGHAYYLDAADPAVAAGPEEPGTWLGAGGSALGLCGEVAGADLEAVLAGYDPAGGERLGLTHHRVRVAAFDLTFCAPKSVSLLHALGDAEVATAVAAGHGAAVEAAMDYVVRHALAVRRTRPGGRTIEPAEATAVAAFAHRTSRVLDPHLHTHAVTANLALGPDGTWSALDGRGVYAHRAAADALYHVQLRHELTCRLGVEWGPLAGGRGDLAGVGPGPRHAFSVRSAQIAAEVAALGLTSPRARDLAAHRTRIGRDSTRTTAELREWWHARAVAVGLGPDHLGAVVDRVPRRAAALPDPDALGAVVVDRLATRRRSATRRDVVTETSRSLGAGAPLVFVEAVADALVRDLDARHPGEAGRDRPGVGERAFTVVAGHDAVQGWRKGLSDDRVRGAVAERRALDAALRRRSLATDGGLSRDGLSPVDRGRDDPTPDLGYGFGLGFA